LQEQKFHGLVGALKQEAEMPKRAPQRSSRDELAVPDRTSTKGTSRLFGKIANRTSQAAGRATTFMIAFGVVLVWAVTGPIFNYSDTWQLVINTGTTIVTFLMVFLIQNSQNRDGAAIQVKLDELIRVSAAHNSFVGIEHLTDDELEDIRTKCELRAQAEKAGDATVERTGKKARRAADQAVG
jgi:low affinity Fe/Cu permease